MTRPPDPVHREEAHVLFIDHLRGLAILLVFLFHGYLVAFASATPPSWSNFPAFVSGHPARWLLFPLASGWVGVPIFFVISGFCIHLSHARSRDRGWRPFFVRRFFRIYPPYLVALLFFAFALPVSRLAFEQPHMPRDLVVLFTHLTLTHNFVSASIIRINGAFWTIAVEAQLYAIYPVLLAMVRRIGWNRSLLVTLLLEIILSHLPLVAGSSAPWFLSVLTKGPVAYWFTWTLGARIADDWLELRPLFLARFPLALLLAGFVITSLVSDRERFAFLFGALAAGCVIARCLEKPPKPNGLLTSSLGRQLRFVGLVSYSLYLLHEPFLDLIPWLFPPLAQRPLALLSLSLAEWPAAVLLAWAYFRWIERPSIACGKMLARNSANPPPHASPVLL